jgi:hypothetical protein
MSAETGATLAVGIPTQVLRLARQTPLPPNLRVHSVLLTTDHVPMSLACAVETPNGGRVLNLDGMAEMGLGGGVDFMARRGDHPVASRLLGMLNVRMRSW